MPKHPLSKNSPKPSAFPCQLVASLKPELICLDLNSCILNLKLVPESLKIEPEHGSVLQKICTGTCGGKEAETCNPPMLPHIAKERPGEFRAFVV